MNPKGINFLHRGRRVAEVCGEGGLWSPVPPGRSQLLSLCTLLEPGAPCLGHGSDPMEQSLPLPGPLVLEPSHAPALGWGAEVKERLSVLPANPTHAKRSMHGATLPESHSNSSMDSPEQKGEHLWSSQQFDKRKLGSPTGNLLPGAFATSCHL